MKFLIAIISSLVVHGAAHSNHDCTELAVGVDLLRCPLHRWSTADQVTSAENPLQIQYRTTVQSMPAVNQTSGRVIDGEFINMTVKTYQIEGYEPRNPSPIWFWKKGATVYINLTNNLHINYQDDTDEFQINESEWKDEHWSVNIHTHGLHISSSEDDPSRTIHVSESRMFDFHLPGNHAGGYHWYHPHIEAISEITVGSGTFGPLVVETANDSSELPGEIEELTQHIFVITKMFPAKLIDLSDGFEKGTDFINGVFPRRDLIDNTFKVSYNEDMEDVIQIEEPNTNYTLVNGYLKPKVTIVSNKWYRFAFLFVGGGNEETDLPDVKLKIGPNTEMHANQSSDYGDLYTEENTACVTKLLAKDGVYLYESRDLNFTAGDKIWTSPANRFEILIKCSFDEAYKGVDNSLALILDTPEEPNRAEDEFTLHSVPILQLEIIEFPASHKHLTSLSSKADTFQSQTCHPDYLPDMRGDNIQLTPHVSEEYTDNVLSSIREATLSGDFYNADTKTLNITVSPFNINGDYFRGYFAENKALNMTVLQLQKVYQFNVDHGHHPLHVHVNHMQLQTAPNDGSGYHQAGDFVDTLASACLSSGCVNFTPRPSVEDTYFRMYTDRYDGRMIGHCHNMDHSDSLALGEMFVLPAEEDLLFVEEPQWQDSCSIQLDLLLHLE